MKPIDNPIEKAFEMFPFGCHINVEVRMSGPSPEYRTSFNYRGKSFLPGSGRSFPLLESVNYALDAFKKMFPVNYTLHQFQILHDAMLKVSGTTRSETPCVGFLKRHCYDWVKYQPKAAGKPIYPNDESINFVPEGVTPVGGNRLAVKVVDENYEEAKRQLAEWVKHLNQIGVALVDYESNSTIPHPHYPDRLDNQHSSLRPVAHIRKDLA